MSVENERDLIGLMRIGRIVGMTMKIMVEALRPGMTTAELDRIGAETLKRYGARSAPQLVYRFPSATCISVNDEVAHGIAGDRVICAGDVVNVDVSAELGGYFADSGTTVPLAPVSPQVERLCACARKALSRAIDTAMADNRINAIGRVVQNTAEESGFRVIRDLRGHGIGRSIHENPTVPNYYTNRAKEKLTEGLVITIEPFVTNGSGEAYTADDGWTLKTTDGSLFAQYEHTMIIQRGKPVLLTAV